MVSKAETEKLIKQVCDRIDSIGVEKLAGKLMQFEFPDLGTGWLIKIASDGTVESCQEMIDKKLAYTTTIMDSDTFEKIITRTATPFDLFAAGKIKVEGTQEALLLFLPILG